MFVDGLCGGSLLFCFGVKIFLTMDLEGDIYLVFSFIVIGWVWPTTCSNGHHHIIKVQFICDSRNNYSFLFCKLPAVEDMHKTG